MPFRNTPSLGPDVEQVGPHYHDAARGVTKNNVAIAGSPQVGATVNTTAGRSAVYAVNGPAALAANARVNLDANFVATASASGTHYAAVAVPIGVSFLAVVFAP